MSDGLISDTCLVYLDDIIILSKTFDETLGNFKLLMDRIREHKLLVKARKCELSKISIAFLGQIVSEEGIATDPIKVDNICNLPAPTDKGGVKVILGHGNYYKRFIKGYHVITAPLQELLKKSVRFTWTDRQEKAFIIIKDAFYMAPVLSYPDPDALYIMDMDASSLAIGAVLSQV